LHNIIPQVGKSWVRNAN